MKEIAYLFVAAAADTAHSPISTHPSLAQFSPRRGFQNARLPSRVKPATPSYEYDTKVSAGMASSSRKWACEGSGRMEVGRRGWGRGAMWQVAVMGAEQKRMKRR